MSQDDTIVITQWNDGWRVCHAQAIENINYYEPNTPEWEEQNRRYFKDSEIYSTREAAIEKAKKLLYIAENIGSRFSEYGICIIDENRGDFPYVREVINDD